MSKKLFIGNIEWSATDEELKDFFSQYGAVEEAVIINDKFSGRSRGFGFVTFENEADADKAIQEANGKDFKGRNIVVNEAKPPRNDNDSE